MAASRHRAETGSRTGRMVVADERVRRLPGGIAVHRAALALVRGDPAATVTHAQLALDLLQEDDHLGHGAAAALSGSRPGRRRPGGGAPAYAECMASMLRAGHISDVLGCSITLADIRITQGRLGDAMRTYEQALRLAAEPTARCCGEPPTCTSA